MNKCNHKYIQLAGVEPMYQKTTDRGNYSQTRIWFYCSSCLDIQNKVINSNLAVKSFIPTHWEGSSGDDSPGEIKLEKSH